MATIDSKRAPYSTEELEPVRRALQHRRLQLVQSAAAEARELADEAEQMPKMITKIISLVV